jgi:hypothetical protein
MRLRTVRVPTRLAITPRNREGQVHYSQADEPPAR